MSRLAIIKIHDDELTEDEGLTVIRQILEAFDLRATVMQHREESRYWVIDNLSEHNYKDLDESMDDLVALVDEESGGVVGYLLPDHAETITEQLNGEEPR